jgi:thiol-disulfide isomerase/thioredoxin
MRIIFLALLMIMSTYSFSQEVYDVSKDEKTGFLVYKGPLTFRDLTFEDNFKPWMKETRHYKPDTTAMKYLKANLNKFKLVVFLGTWCDDSHNMIPKLYNVLQAAGYPMGQLMMYGVDREKKTKDDVQLLYGIKNVPTVIVYSSNKEVGRITELVKKSVEKDLQGIIEKYLENK